MYTVTELVRGTFPRTNFIKKGIELVNTERTEEDKRDGEREREREMQEHMQKRYVSTILFSLYYMMMCNKKLPTKMSTIRTVTTAIIKDVSVYRLPHWQALVGNSLTPNPLDTPKVFTHMHTHSLVFKVDNSHYQEQISNNYG